MTVLVAGGRGQLGTWLAELGGGSDAVRVVGRDELDLLSGVDALERVVRANDARVVVDAAAYTDVDGAEDDVAGAEAVNRDGAAALAAACARVGVSLIHVSTDYVFDGRAPESGRPLRAGDPVGPASVYGRTKLDGERAVLAAHPAALVVRTAWVYTGPARGRLGLGGSDFVATMLALEASRDEIRVVDDQVGSPTYARDLATGILALARAAAAGDAPAGRVLHAAGGGRASWFELARAVFAGVGADPGRVLPCTTAEFPRPAPRPAFSVLSSDEWAEAGMRPLRDWRPALAEALADR